MVITGHHHHIGDAAVMQGFDGLGGLCPQRIRDAQHRRQTSANAQIQMGIAGIQSVEPILLLFRHHAVLILKDKMGAADNYLVTVHHTGNAVGHNILHLGMVLLMVQPPLLGLLHHSVGDGVGIVLLQAGRQAKHLRGRPAAEGHNLGHRGSRIGQGTGLVENNGIRLGHILQEPAALDGNVELGAFPHGAEDRNGHS